MAKKTAESAAKKAATKPAAKKAAPEKKTAAANATPKPLKEQFKGVACDSCCDASRC
ncbi:hypothetical protein [Paraburkholderia sp. WSM4174]|uniref:hypothetical protein n=1 Tax=Paraburkholderia TaxID=1822464 RepID=UPI00039C6AD6|nr:topoisomerase IA-like protein [Paraburkholderia sp. WSM4179]